MLLPILLVAETTLVCIQMQAVTRILWLSPLLSTGEHLVEKKLLTVEEPTPAEQLKD